MSRLTISMIAPTACPDYHWQLMKRILIWIAVGFAGLILVGYIVFSFWLNSYLRGDSFRTLLNRKTSIFLHADGQYLPFHWTGFSVYSDGYQAHGKPGTVFRDLQADQIRAEFQPQGIFHHAWEIDELTIQRLQVNLTPTTLDVEFPPTSSAGSAHSSWVPNRLDLRKTQINDLNLTWSAPSQTANIRQTRAIIEPEDRAWIISAHGGQLRQTGWPVLNIDHLRLRYQAPELFITDGQLKLSDSENVNITGQANFSSQPVVDLQIKINGVVVTPFLPADWRAKLKGIANGDARLSGRFDNLETITATGKLNLTGAQLEALPVLDKIALFTRTEQFRQLVFQKASMDFIWMKSKLTINHILMESEGLLRIEGDCIVAQEKLDGLFQVGVAPTSLRWIPGSQARVFTVERNGYVWTPVRVTGPLVNLKEDLSQRLITAAGTEILEGVKGSLEKGAKDLLDLLKSPAP